MININEALLEEPVLSSFEKGGEEVKVVNFTLVKKYGSSKEYTKCSVYGGKSELVKDFNKGNLIYVLSYFKERFKGEKVFKNFIGKSLSNIENKDTNEKNKEENEYGIFHTGSRCIKDDIKYM